MRTGESTFFESRPQVRNLAGRAADPIDALVLNPVLLDGLAAFSHDWRYLDVISVHLLCEVDAERRPSLVLYAIDAVRRRRYRRVRLLIEGWERWQLGQRLLSQVASMNVCRLTKPSSDGPSRRGPRGGALPRANA